MLSASLAALLAVQPVPEAPPIPPQADEPSLMDTIAAEDPGDDWFAQSYDLVATVSTDSEGRQVIDITHAPLDMPACEQERILWQWTSDALNLPLEPDPCP